MANINVTVEPEQTIEVTIEGGSGGSGTTNHALLTNLDYASSGHTGFASTSSLASYVPYTGATGNVDLGDNSFTLGAPVLGLFEGVRLSKAYGLNVFEGNPSDEHPEVGALIAGIRVVGNEIIFGTHEFGIYKDVVIQTEDNSDLSAGKDIILRPGLGDDAPNGNVKFARLTSNGFLKTSNSDGTVIEDTNTYLTTTDAGTTYVPYTGATANVNLGSKQLYTTGLLGVTNTNNSSWIYFTSSPYPTAYFYHKSTLGDFYLASTIRSQLESEKVQLIIGDGYGTNQVGQIRIQPGIYDGVFQDIKLESNVIVGYDDGFEHVAGNITAFGNITAEGNIKGPKLIVSGTTNDIGFKVSPRNAAQVDLIDSASSLKTLNAEDMQTLGGDFWAYSRNPLLLDFAEGDLLVSMNTNVAAKSSGITHWYRDEYLWSTVGEYKRYGYSEPIVPEAGRIQIKGNTSNVTTPDATRIFLLRDFVDGIHMHNNVGIGTQFTYYDYDVANMPTAWLHLGLGSTTKAPLRFTSGPLRTVPEVGTIEYLDGTFYLQSDSLNVDGSISCLNILDNAATPLTSIDPNNRILYGIDGTTQAINYSMADGVQMNTGGTNTARLVSATEAGYFTGTGGNVYLVDSSYALNVTGYTKLDGTTEIISGGLYVYNSGTGQGSPYDTNRVFEVGGYSGFTDGTKTASFLDASGNVAYFSKDSYSTTFIDGNQAAIFSDGTNQVNFCDSFNSILADGNVGILGDLKVGYDSSNYITMTVGSANEITITNAVAADISVNCGTDKTLVLTETVWDDLPPANFSNATIPPANAPNYTTFSGNFKQYQFDIDDYIYLQPIEVMHSYKEGTDFLVHIHWATGGTDVDARYVKWQVEYLIADGMETFSGTTISNEVEIPAGTAALTHMISDIDVISGTNFKIGAYILCIVKRITADGTAPSDDPFGLALGVHVQQDTLGSRQLYIK